MFINKGADTAFAAGLMPFNSHLQLSLCNRPYPGLVSSPCSSDGVRRHSKQSCDNTYSRAISEELDYPFNLNWVHLHFNATILTLR